MSRPEPRIETKLADSVPMPAPKTYDPDSPNVLVVLFDDLGFAQLGSYGSDLETPNLDRLAASGVRFTNFHTTGMCSPTRAAVLTARNHHRVGMGMLPDLPVNYPGYTGVFPTGAGTLGHILGAEGYATTAIGKWHLVPRDQRANGPFHMWPTQQGFDRYYGFLNGETNMWTPNLIRDQTHVEPPRTPDEGYHLEADLADEAIRQLRDHQVHQPDRPFFMWYATATPHAPHQAPPEWIERFAGKFDDGWDAWRARVHAQQVEQGIVAPGTEPAPRPPWVEAWDDIDADRRRLYARMMEVFAGFLAHADHQVGRVLDHIEQMGEADNTIVVFMSDNGCSAEGGPNGTWNQLRHYITDLPDDIDEELAHIDDLGGFRSSGHYPWGWAFAGNTPFRRWKRYTFEGGTRDPFIVSWPKGSADGRLGPGGSIRNHYCHAVDVMPTLLDLAGIHAPSELRGVEQMSFDGVSLAPVLADDAVPDQRTEQYYELWGSRAIYRDGWKAVTNHVNQLTAHERDHLEGSADFDDDHWALFDTSTDPTEAHDLGEQHPDKLAELVAAWDDAAERNQVLPLDDGRENRMPQMHLPWYRFSTEFHFARGDKVHEANGPILFGAFRMVALFPDGLEANASGVLAEQGDWISGWVLSLVDGRALWVFTGSGFEAHLDAPVPAGTLALEVRLTDRDGGGYDATLSADGADIATVAVDGRLPGAISPDGAFLTVGYGRPFPVSEDYDPTVPAPPSFGGLRIDVGAVPEFDVEAEIARVLRHQ